MQKVTLDNPNNFLDRLAERAGVKSDAQLSRLLRLGPPVISKIRHGRTGLTGDVIVTIHEATSLSIREIKDMAGLRTEAYPTIESVVSKPDRRLQMRRKMGLPA